MDIFVPFTSSILAEISQITSKSAWTIPKLHRRWNVFPALASDGLMLVIWRSSEAHSAILSSSTHTPPVDFISQSSSSTYAGTGLRRRSSIRLRIFRNSSLGTATSANWDVTYRPWRTTLAPILTSFSRSVVNDQRSTSFGKANVPMNLARL